jgi:predicted enzyme related to lactoylglutathione lyase
MGHVAIVVDDYDRAIEYYTKKLVLSWSKTHQPGKRWVVVTPNPESDCHLRHGPPMTRRKRLLVISGGRVFLLQTDDLATIMP